MARVKGQKDLGAGITLVPTAHYAGETIAASPRKTAPAKAFNVYLDGQLVGAINNTWLRIPKKAPGARYSYGESLHLVWTGAVDNALADRLGLAYDARRIGIISSIRSAPAAAEAIFHRLSTLLPGAKEAYDHLVRVRHGRRGVGAPPPEGSPDMDTVNAKVLLEIPDPLKGSPRPVIVHRYRIATTPFVVYSAWEETNPMRRDTAFIADQTFQDHGTITSTSFGDVPGARGVWWGRIGTGDPVSLWQAVQQGRLSIPALEGLGTLPRAEAIRAIYEWQYGLAYDAIARAFPEAAYALHSLPAGYPGVSRSMGELEINPVVMQELAPFQQFRPVVEDYERFAAVRPVRPSVETSARPVKRRSRKK